MDLGLRGRAALVTGASRGIGRGIALELAREGCRVALCARGKDALDAAAAEVRALGVEVVAVPADVTTADGVREAVEAALTAFGASTSSSTTSAARPAARSSRRARRTGSAPST